MLVEDRAFDSISSMLNGDITTQPKHISDKGIYLAKAPNQLVFIESEDFLGGPELFPVQRNIVRDFFELLCPHCNDVPRLHISNDVPIDEQILFEYDVCPECGLAKADIGNQFNYYNELIGVMGMRSGKGVVLGCIGGALVHEILCTENLQEQLGLVKNQEIDGAFVAASGEQASETVYGHFKGFYESSPWFQELKKKLMDKELTDPKLRRGDLYRESERIIHFKFKNIKLKSLHSNSSTIAGKTRIFAIIDELARFDMGSSKQSATEVYRVLKRSLMTIKARVSKLRKQGIYNIPDAKMFCVTSPLFLDDMSMQLLRQAKDQEKMFAFRRATWEANPNITKEDLADEYQSDPLGSERDYGANPPGAESPLIQDSKLIDICIDTERPSNLTLKEVHFDVEAQGVKFNYLKIEVVNVTYRNLYDYVIACDPGRTKDTFAITLAHLEENVFVIDGSIEARPIPKSNREGMIPRQVHFPSMTSIIVEFNKKLSLKAVSYDTWNSLAEIDRLRDANILSMGKNLDREDHILFVESMRSNRAKFPMPETTTLNPMLNRNLPIAKALMELRMLEDNGKKVDHGRNGTNDIIQTWVACHRLLVTPEKIIDMKDIMGNKRRQLAGRQLGRRIGKVVKLKRFI